jgi:carnitine 3-dehydrogenase
MKLIDRAAIIGGGVIGAGWIARLIENGIDVTVYDPADDAAQKVEAVLKNSRHAYAKLTSAPRRKEGGLTFCDTIAEAVAGAELIVESVPERLDIKQSVYAEIEAHAADDAIVASSTSGIMPSDLQAKMQHPERLLVAHPFNPVYLLPLVELVGGEKTAAVTIERAGEIYHSLGMHPLHVKKEIEAFIADRLLEAIWRESLWLVKDGIATTRDIDDAVRRGRHASLHGAVRSLPEMAVDQADGRARVHRRTGRPDRRAVGRTVRLHEHPRNGAHSRRQPDRNTAGAQGQRLGCGTHAGALRATTHGSRQRRLI